MDIDRQWFKSKVGLGAPETHRDLSFCTYTVLPESPDVFVVLNANNDPRFAGTPLVVGAPHVIFYAGAALWVGGEKLGSLCIIDNVPHDSFSLADQQNLMDIAGAVSQLIEGRRAQFLRGRKRQSQQILSLTHNLRTPCMSLELSVKSLVSNLSNALSSMTALDMQSQTEHLVKLVRHLTDLCAFMPSLAVSNDVCEVNKLRTNGYSCDIPSIIDKMHAILGLICEKNTLNIEVDPRLQCSHATYISFPEVFSIVALDLIGNCAAFSKDFDVKIFFKNNVNDSLADEYETSGRIVIDLITRNSFPTSDDKGLGERSLLNHNALLDGVGGGWAVEHHEETNFACFSYWLPLSLDMKSDTADLCQGKPSSSSDEEQRQLRVLVLENEATTQEKIVQLLCNDGLDVHVRSNGALGLSEFTEAYEMSKPYDFVFISLLMPVMHGGTFMKKALTWLQQYSLKEGEEKVHSPYFVGMLGSCDTVADYIPVGWNHSDEISENSEHPSCEMLGMSHILRKPLVASEVCATVEGSGLSNRRRKSGDLQMIPVNMKRCRSGSWMGRFLGSARVSPVCDTMQ